MDEMYSTMPGSPITYLVGDISAGQTTIAIADDTALPDAPNICTIGYGEHIETIRYGTKFNGVLQQVTRGIEGTPRAWPSGTEVARFFTAYDHNALIEAHTSHLADYASLLEGGEIYQAVLQNGFTQTLNYRKNGIGIVHLWGQVRGETAGTESTTIATLPEGFRPKENLNLSVLRYGARFPLERAYLTSAGELKIPDPWPLAGHIINILYQV